MVQQQRCLADIINQVKVASEHSLKLLDDKYEEFAVFSMCWANDETGGAEDCDLFIQTMFKIPCSSKWQQTYVIQENDTEIDIIAPMTQLIKQMNKAKRGLLIVHYAGHGTKGSTSSNLMLVPVIGQENDKPALKFHYIKQNLMGSAEHGLDVLMVMDCCCAAAGAGRGSYKNGRVEFVAATTQEGISNSREDGQTFTQAWCIAFEALMEQKKLFCTEDVITQLSTKQNENLAQFPYCFVLQEGSELKISFNPNREPGQQQVTNVSKLKAMMVAFHATEDSLKIEDIADKLGSLNVAVRVVAVLPAASSLIILEIPEILGEFLQGIGQYYTPLCRTSKVVYFHDGMLDWK